MVRAFQSGRFEGINHLLQIAYSEQSGSQVTGPTCIEMDFQHPNLPTQHSSKPYFDLIRAATVLRLLGPPIPFSY